jgi:murein DD-endopeptidase MepM/ murein hydrolase activator NlpD
LPDLFHTIVRGDTLSEIARSYDTNVSTLVAINNLGSSHRIRAGQRLRLPAAGPVPQAETVVEASPEPPADEAIAAVALPELSELPAIASAPVEETVDPGALADDRGATITGALESSLLSDPSDYTVARHNFFVKTTSISFEESFDTALDSIINQIKRKKEKLAA